MLDLSGNSNVGKVILRGEGMACLRTLITYCLFVSLEIVTAAPALTQHYYTNTLKLFVVVFIQWWTGSSVGGQTDINSGLVTLGV